MNRLVLIDGNAVLHRAYHAIPPLTAPDGSVVNAVYGFATMLMRLYTDLRPTHIAVVFDRPAPTFRKKLYKEYQATRPKMEDALVGQIEKVHALVRAFDVPIYEKDGFEADDIIGTLCKKIQNSKSKIQNKSKGQSANAQTIDQVIIVTGDRDILQLVDDTTFVYMPTKGLSEAKLYKDADVKERLGVLPNKIVDYKGLAGDASDNYPGVDGIGPKTAISLLESFGSVEGVYAALKKHDAKIQKLTPSIIERLKTGEANARLSKKLATIKRDVDVKESLDKMQIHSLDTPEARKFFDLMHFHSLLKRLTGGVETEKKSPHRRPAGEAGENKSEQQQLF